MMRTKEELLDEAYREEGYAAVRSTETRLIVTMLTMQLEVLLDIRDILMKEKA